MREQRFLRWATFGLIFAFWIAVLFAFLHAPRYLSVLYGDTSLNVLALPGMFDAAHLRQFEEKNGIRVSVTQFEQPEELFVKLQTTREANYDLIMAPSYVVMPLIAEGKIKKLDKEQISFWDRLYPILLNHHFDPGNLYTIPYAWDACGVAINRDFFDQDPEPSWRILFKPQHVNQRIAMFESAREIAMVAALYLFGQRETLSEEDAQKLFTLLLDQKQYVAAYSDLRVDYLLMSGTVTAAMAWAADIARAVPHHESLHFLVPKEGMPVEIDSLAIPAGTRKEQYVYQLLNHLYQADIMEQYVNRLGIFSALRDVKSIHTRLPFLIPDEQMFSKLYFSRNVVHPEKLTELWVTLKS